MPLAADRDWETATLFGIESQRLAEANLARARARQAIAGGIGSLAMMGIGGQFKGMFGGGNNIVGMPLYTAPTLNQAAGITSPGFTLPGANTPLYMQGSLFNTLKR